MADERWKSYMQSNEHQSLRDKTMWSGAKSKLDSKEHVIRDGKFIYATITYTPTIKQMVAEIIANVLDLLNDTITLEIRFTRQGHIEITNTGNGIPVIPHPQHADKYIPEICCEPHGGSNIKVDNMHVSAGTNGIGLKMVYMNSIKFELLTSDTIARKLFYICFTMSNDEVTKHPYKIIDYIYAHDSLKQGFTKISFTPDYKHLDYTLHSTGQDDELNDVDFANIRDIIHTLAFITKLYRPGLNVIYNGANVIIPELHCSRSIVDISLYRATKYIYNQYMINKNEPLLFTFTHNGLKHPNSLVNFNVRVSASVNTDGNARSILIINGIYVVSSTILTLVTDFFKENLSSKVKTISTSTHTQSNNRALLSYLNLIIIVDVPSMYMQPSSQIKDKIDINKEYMAKYVPPDVTDDKVKKMLNTLWRLLKECLENKFGKETKKGKYVVTSDIYTKAERAGTSESSKCGLFIPEGKSPSSLVRNVLPDFKYNGIYILNGVTSNALKKSKKVESDTSHYVPKSTLLKDDRIQKLWQVIGLEHDKHYGNNDIGNANFNNLNYGYICACTDEDDDGTGHIFGLLACYIETYWPELFARHFLRRLLTPIVRVSRKSDYTYVDEDNLITEFYTRYDADEWTNTDENKAKLLNGEYKLYYYKGLGTHKSEEHSLIKKKFEQSIHTFIYNKSDHDLFELFYGKSTANRKKELMTPVMIPSKSYLEWCKTNKAIPAEYQLKIVVKSFQAMTITRRQLRMVDGNNHVYTQILHTALNKLNTGRESLINFMGSISKLTNYHHGDVSLYGACVTMARKYPGTNLIPLINPDGNYGDRVIKGGAASARYLNTSLNKITKLIFTDEDSELLQYEFEEKYLNPSFFVPIIPIVLLNNNNQIGTGWNTRMYARDITSVITNVLLAIQGNPITPMTISMYKFKGKIKHNDHKHECIVGAYEIISANTIVVTELPFGKYANNYTLKLENKYMLCVASNEASAIIKNIRNTSREDDIRIQITFIKSIEEMFEVSKWSNKYDTLIDPIEVKLELFKLTRPILNLVTIDGFIKEYTTYEEIFNDWFNVRKSFYVKRVGRQLIKMNAELIMHKNIHRFIEEHAIEHIRDVSKATQQQYLIDNKYVAMDTAKMRNTRYIYENDDVNSHIFDKSVNNNVNYKYILDLKISKMSTEFKNKTLKRIDELTNSINNLTGKKWNNFIGDELWLNDIRKLLPVLQQGIESNWTFKRPRKQ